MDRSEFVSEFFFIYNQEYHKMWSIGIEDGMGRAEGNTACCGPGEIKL